MAPPWWRHLFGQQPERYMRGRSAVRRRPMLFVEQLESRIQLDCVLARWIGGSGSWFDPTAWDVGVVPNNSGSTTYCVTIDRLDADPVITVDRNVTVSTLINAETLHVVTGTTVVADNAENRGTIEASGAGTLTLAGADWQNTGTLQAAVGGTINLGGTFSAAELGILRGGGTVNLIGTMNAAGSTLLLDATTGSLNVRGGTIRGGTVSGSDGARLVVPVPHQDATLDGVTLNANLEVASNAQATIVNGLTLNGVATLLGGGTPGTGLNFSGTQALTGTGEVVFAGPGSINFIKPTSGTLTIAPRITIRGAPGTIGDPQLPLINQGTIAADTLGGTITIQASSFTNEGLLEA